jgi:hypothetical protein
VGICLQSQLSIQGVGLSITFYVNHSEPLKPLRLLRAGWSWEDGWFKVICACDHSAGRWTRVVSVLQTHAKHTNSSLYSAVCETQPCEMRTSSELEAPPEVPNYFLRAIRTLKKEHLWIKGTFACPYFTGFTVYKRLRSGVNKQRSSRPFVIFTLASTWRPVFHRGETLKPHRLSDLDAGKAEITVFLNVKGI